VVGLGLSKQGSDAILIVIKWTVNNRKASGEQKVAKGKTERGERRRRVG